MKVAAKTISSPSRTEKFPPPLMRFLRSNVGSKSRGRSRASPMFIRRKNAPIETQEPTSPKVTCIGQVRVRRSSKKSAGVPKKQRRRCWWVHKTLFFIKKLKPRSIFTVRPVLCRWVCFFRFGYCRKSKRSDDSSRIDTNLRNEYQTAKTGDEDVNEERAQEIKDPTVFVSSSPPKNALLLTRCRSAPYRFSSLENQMWVPNLETGDVKSDDDESKEEFKQQEEEEIERPMCESEADSRNSTEKSTIDEESNENSSIAKSNGVPINGRSSADNIGTLKEEMVLPLILTRCKSEPASKGERLINPGYTHIM